MITKMNQVVIETLDQKIFLIKDFMDVITDLDLETLFSIESKL